MVTSDVEHIAYAIRDYLAAHPDGADSVEGVARWWLPALRVVATVEATEAALELLVRQGVVRRQRLSDGGVLYSRCT